MCFYIKRYKPIIFIDSCTRFNSICKNSMFWHWVWKVMWSTNSHVMWLVTNRMLVYLCRWLILGIKYLNSPTLKKSQFEFSYTEKFLKDSVVKNSSFEFSSTEKFTMSILLLWKIHYLCFVTFKWAHLLIFCRLLYLHFGLDELFRLCPEFSSPQSVT